MNCPTFLTRACHKTTCWPIMHYSPFKSSAVASGRMHLPKLLAIASRKMLPFHGSLFQASYKYAYCRIRQDAFFEWNHYRIKKDVRFIYSIVASLNDVSFSFWSKTSVDYDTVVVHRGCSFAHLMQSRSYCSSGHMTMPIQFLASASLKLLIGADSTQGVSFIILQHSWSRNVMCLNLQDTK